MIFDCAVVFGGSFNEFKKNADLLGPFFTYSLEENGAQKKKNHLVRTSSRGGNTTEVRGKSSPWVE